MAIETGAVASRWDPDRHTALVAQKGKLIAEADELKERIDETAISDAAKSDENTRKRMLYNSEHRTKIAELEGICSEIERLENRRPVDPKSEAVTNPRARWLRGGAKNLSAEERQAHIVTDSVPTGFDSALTPQDIDQIRIPAGGLVSEMFVEKIQDGVPADRVLYNTLTSDASPGGQDWTPVLVYPSVADTLSYRGGMLGATSEMVTNSGVDTKFPVLNDAAEEGEILANQVATTADRDLQGLDEKTMKSAIISSKQVKMNLALQQDTAFNMDQVIRQRLDRRLDNTCNKQMTVGDGTGLNFRGATVDAQQGVETAANNAITVDEYMSLPEKIDIAYMSGEGSPAGLNPIGGMGPYRGMMMHQEEIGRLRRIVSSQDGHFVFRPGPATLVVNGAMAGYIEGIPLRYNNHMAKLAAGAIVAMYGNFGYYMRRRVNFRLNARFFDSGTVTTFASHFIAFIREYGRFIGGLPNTAADATEAVKTLQLKA